MKIKERSPSKLELSMNEVSLPRLVATIRDLSGGDVFVLVVGVVLLVLFLIGRLQFDRDIADYGIWTVIVGAFAVYYFVTRLFDLVTRLVFGSWVTLTLTPHPKISTINSVAEGRLWNGERFNASGNGAEGATVTEITRQNTPFYQVHLVRHYGDLLLLDGTSKKDVAESFATVISDWCTEKLAGFPEVADAAAPSDTPVEHTETP